LKLKNALGTDDDGFDYKERDSDISYPYNLDKLRPIFVSLNKDKVPLEGNTNIEKNEMNKKGNNIFESIEAIKKEYILNKLSVSEKQELKKKLLNLLNEIS
jgi:flagellar biosynthesis/type III secretory pathway chaperone